MRVWIPSGRVGRSLAVRDHDLSATACTYVGSREFEDDFAEVAAMRETLEGFAPLRDRECPMYGRSNRLLFHKQSDEVILERLVHAIRAFFQRVRRQGDHVELLATLVFNGFDGTLHRVIMQGTPIDTELFVGEIVRFTANVLQSPLDADPKTSENGS